MIPRRETRQIHIGPVAVGGAARISVQSMTCTPTHDVHATSAQIESLVRVGCEIVRVAVPDARAAEALPAIVRRADIPVIADIHFDHQLALAAIQAGVAALRINPGNLRRREHVEKVVQAARDRNIPMRIGVNAGSLDHTLRERVHAGQITRPEAMVESALGHVRILEEMDFRDIKVSLKASDVVTTVEAYRLLAKRCDYPFHVGITEAGTVWSGTVKSAAGIGILVMDGLADTIRVSLTGPVEEEVRVARAILSALGERRDGPEMISCPTCGRTTIDLIGLAGRVEKILDDVREPIVVAVMGCEVNGPGEAREADIGVAGGAGKGIVFRKGEIVRRCEEAQILDVFRQELDRLLAERRQNP